VAEPTIAPLLSPGRVMVAICPKRAASFFRSALVASVIGLKVPKLTPAMKSSKRGTGFLRQTILASISMRPSISPSIIGWQLTVSTHDLINWVQKQRKPAVRAVGIGTILPRRYPLGPGKRANRTIGETGPVLGS
jgi:hypothetical protein